MPTCAWCDLKVVISTILACSTGLGIIVWFPQCLYLQACNTLQMRVLRKPGLRKPPNGRLASGQLRPLARSVESRGLPPHSMLAPRSPQHPRFLVLVCAACRLWWMERPCPLWRGSRLAPLPHVNAGDGPQGSSSWSSGPLTSVSPWHSVLLSLEFQTHFPMTFSHNLSLQCVQGFCSKASSTIHSRI